MTPPVCFHFLDRLESWVRSRRPAEVAALLLAGAWLGVAVASCLGDCAPTPPDARQAPSYDPGDEGAVEGDTDTDADTDAVMGGEPCADADPIQGGPC